MTLWLHTWSIKMVADMNFVHLFFICWSDFFCSLAIKNQISLGGCQRQLGDSLIKKNDWRDISPIFLDKIIYVLDSLLSVWCECPRIYFYRHEFYDLRQLSCRVNVGIDQGMDRSSSQSDKDKIDKAADHMINDLGS